jgi:hypothetical protein
MQNMEYRFSVLTSRSRSSKPDGESPVLEKKTPPALNLPG